MKDIFEVYGDVIISSVVAVIIIFIGSTCKINNVAINILLNISPPLIVTFAVAINKPKTLSKLIRFSNSHKLTNIKFQTSFENLFISEIQYKNIINKFMHKLPSNQNKKIEIQNIGEYLYKTKLSVEYLGILDILYDSGENIMILSFQYPLRYKVIYKYLTNICTKLHESISEVNSGCKKGNSSLDIRFLNDKKDITNPIVAKVFSGFNIKTIDFKYIGKYNSTVSLHKDKISIYNKESLDNLLHDFKNELML